MWELICGGFRKEISRMSNFWDDVTVILSNVEVYFVPTVEQLPIMERCAI